MPGPHDGGSRLGRVRSFGVQVYRTVREKNVPFMAGSVAFYTFVSLLPLLVLLYLATALVGSGDLTDRVIGLAEAFVPNQGREPFVNALEERTGSASQSLVGLAVLLWGAFRLFGGLDTAFSEIYESSTTESLAEQVVDAAVAFVVLVAAVLAGVVTSGAFAVFPGVPYVRVVSALLLVVGLTLAFYPMFYLFPNVELSALEVLPGVLVAAVGWTLIQGLFQGYLALVSSGETSGVVGGALVLLTWLYFGSFVILLGAVVNAVHAGETRVTRAELGKAPA